MLVGIAGATGCQFDPSGLAPGGGATVDADVPSVDGDTVDGSVIDMDADIPDECEPDTRTCLAPDVLGQCKSDGNGYDQQTCVVACVDAPEPHCGDLVPSNGIPPELLDLGTGALDTEGATTLFFDTDSGRILRDFTELRPALEGLDAATGIGFQVVEQPGSPSIGVFAVASLQVLPGTSLRGIGDNAMAIVAGGDIVISGVIDMTGGPAACRAASPFDESEQCPGPGGMPGGDHQSAAPGPGAGGRGTGGGSGLAEGGGGGGGHHAEGGTGGVGQGDVPSENGAPGPVFAAATLTPLTGGGGGGGGGNEPRTFSTDAGGAGGGGGGALQLVSHTVIELRPEGEQACGINAGGGGADGASSSAGGGGGGAGGGILLEAPDVALLPGCVLAANGGGGSGGSDSLQGDTGLLSDQPALGSLGEAQRASGNGGNGGTRASPTGGVGGNSTNEAGGGGGGVGAIHINTAGGFDEQGIVSPAPSTGAVIIE